MSRPSEKIVLEAFSNERKTNVEIVEYGSTLVSEGYIAPKGTVLYPVKLKYRWFDNVDRTPMEDVVYFYKDEFGKWLWYKK